MFPQKSVLDTFQARAWLLTRLAKAISQSINEYDYPLHTTELVQVAMLAAEFFARDLADAVDSLANHPDAIQERISQCSSRLEELADEFRAVRIKAVFWDPETPREREAAALYLASLALLHLGRLEAIIDDFKIFDALKSARELRVPASLLP